MCIFKFLSVVGAVSFGQIVKAGEPVFAAFTGALLLKEIDHPVVYLSLIPIIGGVGLASLKVAFTNKQRNFHHLADRRGKDMSDGPCILFLNIILDTQDGKETTFMYLSIFFAK